MYSHEIKQLLEIKQNILTAQEYIKMVDESPQIDHIIFQDEHFDLFTKDNYKFKFKIKAIKKN